MPHIIVEYSRTLEDHLNIPRLLETLHDSLASQGIDKSRIKTRGIKIDHAYVGDYGLKGHMMHATLLLLEGRDVATKKQYGDPLYAAMKEAVAEKLPNCAATLEIRDMVKDTYYL